MNKKTGSSLTIRKVAKAAKYAIFQDSYGGGYCLYNNKSFGSLRELWEYIQTTEGSEEPPVLPVRQ